MATQYSSNMGASSSGIPETASAMDALLDPTPGAAASEEESAASDEMDEGQFVASVKASIDEAVDYIDGYIAPQRAKATAYYRGDEFGNEEDGRSRIVMTEVRDTVQAIVPSLLRIFTSSDQVVEFAPNTADKTDMAAQQTDYINHVFYNDNPGFSILHQVFKDALVRRTGVIKWRWSEDTEISEAEFENLDEGQLLVLQQDPAVEIVEIEEETEQEAVTGPDGMMVQPAIVKYGVKIRRKIEKNRVVLESVPPEEFLIARDARDIENAAYVGHRSLKTVSELVAMGYDRDEVEEHAGQGDVFVLNYEAQTRNPAIMSFMDRSDNPDQTMRRVLYVESYVRIDKDGDGIAELRKVCSIGGAHHILHDSVATDVPFAFFCPDPEPHMVIGQSIADQTMDLQLMKSNVVRATLDSLAQSIFPRTAIVEGQVNIDDVLNTEMGGIIRMRQPGMVQPFSQPFVGQQAMPVIAYLDDVKARRTGISAASQGLDPDVLQSTTRAAVTATVQGAQERIELVARLFAENGMKRLFRGLLKLIVRHQDKPRVVRMRGKWVEVDPRYWDADLDVQVNVALGRGTDQDKMQFLMLLAQKQEQIMQTAGPMNPLCSVFEYRNTLAQVCALAGFKDAQRYFKEIDPQQMQMMAQQPPPPDPNMELVKIEAQKAQAKIQHDQLKLQLDAQEIQMRHQSDMEKMRLETMVKVAEIEAKYGTQADVARLEAEIKRGIEIEKASIGAAARMHGNVTGVGNG